MSNRMTEVTDDLYDYILSVSSREPELFWKLRQETAQLGSIGGMQISPDQAQFMALLVELLNARTYVEVGTFTGYSALACALALPPDGKVIACDVSEEWTAIARKYWEEAGVSDKIELRLGPAVEILNTLLSQGYAEQVDLMFIDADKLNYDAYYELGLKLVRPGGLILIDNVLWHGAVIDEQDQDKSTEAIRALNRKLHQDERISLSLLTVADGLTLARRR